MNASQAGAVRGRGPALPPLPPLHALRAFHAAASFASFREAAAALSLTESAISHQVRKLEKYLGVQLFEREGNRVRLSAAGRRYFEGIDPAFAGIRRATVALTGPGRRVSLTLTRSLATMWLIPRLARLEAEMPEIDLQIIATSRLCDLEREEIDLGIRYGRGSWPGLVARHLFDEQVFPVCRADLVPEGWDGRLASLLGACRIIGDRLEEWRDWAAARGEPLAETQRGLEFDLEHDVLEAAVEGLGIAMSRSPLADRYLADGRLVAPFGTAGRTGLGYFLVEPAGRVPTAAARRVARWLIAAAGAGQAAAGP